MKNQNLKTVQVEKNRSWFESNVGPFDNGTAESHTLLSLELWGEISRRNRDHLAQLFTTAEERKILSGLVSRIQLEKATGESLARRTAHLELHAAEFAVEEAGFTKNSQHTTACTDKIKRLGFTDRLLLLDCISRWHHSRSTSTSEIFQVGW